MKTSQSYFLTGEAFRTNAIKAINALEIKEKSPFVVTISEQKRSLAQNAKLWAMLGEVAHQVCWHGRYLHAEDWKHIFTSSLKKMDVVPNIENNGFVVIGLSSKNMTKKEFIDLIELINAFGADNNVKFSDASKQLIDWSRQFWRGSNDA